MITNLHIKNIGIIDDINIALNSGFNVLTGETGAGKSLIVDSLSIICGGRFSKEMIRKGSNYSLVEACIYLPNNEISEEGNIIVSREVYENGRNLCKINGRMVTVSQLKSFMQDIIDIHGQSDNQKLMQIQNHIKYLDDFIGKQIECLKDEYKVLFDEYQGIRNELRKNYGDDKEKQRKLDLLYYQLNEISNSNLKISEDEILEKKQKLMQNSEKVATNLSKINNYLGEQSLNAIDNAISCFNKICGYDDKYNKLLEKIQSIYYDVQDISYTISSDFENLEFDQSESEKIQDRLDLIFNLKRKYGNTIDEILNYKEKLECQIKEIENLDDYILSLKERLKIVKSKMYNICKQMNEIRVKNSVILENKITSELKDLEMVNAKFKINVIFLDNEDYMATGLDDVEFMISTNVGEEYKSLVKVASGGEISRIMLAIKNVFSNVDKTPIMIFDEIDTGISGVAAKSVSEKINAISKNHQVICVTHLAVIAAKANYNYFISKDVLDGKTFSSIKLLNEEETLNEIARIATGNISKVALQHAMELRKECMAG